MYPAPIDNTHFVVNQSSRGNVVIVMVDLYRIGTITFTNLKSF